MAHMHGRRSVRLRIIERPKDRYLINVFPDVREFVSYLEGRGVEWADAARYAADGNVFIFAPEKRRDVIVGIYSKSPRHGVLEIYELIHPENLTPVLQELMDSVENVRSQT